MKDIDRRPGTVYEGCLFYGAALVAAWLFAMLYLARYF